MADERYALFGGRDYYPEGGAYDFIGWADSVGAAKSSALDATHCEWFQIADEDLKPLLRGGWGKSRREGRAINWREDS